MMQNFRNRSPYINVLKTRDRNESDACLAKMTTICSFFIETLPKGMKTGQQSFKKQ